MSLAPYTLGTKTFVGLTLNRKIVHLTLIFINHIYMSDLNTLPPQILCYERDTPYGKSPATKYICPCFSATLYCFSILYSILFYSLLSCTKNLVFSDSMLVFSKGPTVLSVIHSEAAALSTR